MNRPRREALRLLISEVRKEELARHPANTRARPPTGERNEPHKPPSQASPLREGRRGGSWRGSRSRMRNAVTSTASSTTGSAKHTCLRKTDFCRASTHCKSTGNARASPDGIYRGQRADLTVDRREGCRSATIVFRVGLRTATTPITPLVPTTSCQTIASGSRRRHEMNGSLP